MFLCSQSKYIGVTRLVLFLIRKQPLLFDFFRLFLKEKKTPKQDNYFLLNTHLSLLLINYCIIHMHGATSKKSLEERAVYLKDPARLEE